MDIFANNGIMQEHARQVLFTLCLSARLQHCSTKHCHGMAWLLVRYLLCTGTASSLSPLDTA
jgi:hypothetical protein